MYSCLNQQWASSWPIRQHHKQYPPNFRCSPRSGESFVHFFFAPRATTLSKVVWHSIRFSPFAGPLPTGAMNPAWFLSSRENSRLHPSNLQFPGKPLQPCSDGTDSTSNAVACLVSQFCSCKLLFGYHHLRVHWFVSRTPQHFCSIVEY